MTAAGGAAGPAAPQISVVIPTHGRWPLLQRALQAALGQQDVEVEVVVVDDGSPDETAARLAQIDDARLRVVHHAVATGVSRARNDGIAAARAPWLAFLDDDDLWAPRKCADQLAAAHAGGAGWAWSGAIVVDAGLRPLRLTPATEPDGIAERLLAHSPIQGPSAVIARTDLVRELGGFDEAFSAMADWDLWLRLSERAPGAALREPATAYLEHAANMLASDRDPARSRAEFERLAAKHAARAAAAGVTFGAVWWTRWVASRQRLAGRRGAAARTYLAGAVRDRSAGDAVRAAGALLGPRGWDAVRGVAVGRLSSPAWLDAYR